MSFPSTVGTYEPFEAIFKRLSAFTDLDLLYYADAVNVAVCEFGVNLHLSASKAGILVGLLNRFTVEDNMSLTTFKILCGRRERPDLASFFLLGRTGGLDFLLLVSLRSGSTQPSLGACFLIRMNTIG